jgi:hypothetical protein
MNDKKTIKRFPVKVHVTPEEKEKLKARAKQAGLSLSRYLLTVGLARQTGIAVPARAAYHHVGARHGCWEAANMLNGWSHHQVSDNPIQPSKYMLDAAVEKDFSDGRGLEVRAPVPELLMGHQAVFQSALKVSKSGLRYRVATLSFAAEDVEVESFNSGDVETRKTISVAINLFLEMAFAGIPPDHRPPILIGTHTHTGWLEINIAVPRYVVSASGKVRSFNPHPP